MTSLNSEQKNRRLAQILLSWWDKGHNDLPWRRTNSPYAIWISEIMLQQTQIATVIPYYERWMAEFPTISKLANSSLDQVLKLWEGLGYYSRARNLYSAAQTIQSRFDGRLPQSVPELLTLKGIGPYTAGAIASIAFDQAVPVLDGNVTRVFSGVFDLGQDVTLSATKKQLWELAADHVPAKRAGDYNQALMELGQTVCLSAKPRCTACPLEAICLARSRGTQLDRPVRPPRKNIPHFDVVAAIIWQDEHRKIDSRFLITRRPLDGLLGGLWEFPGGKKGEGETNANALAREIMEEIALEIVAGQQLATVKHAYTHYRITLRAYHARWISGIPQHLGVTSHAWVSLAELDSYAFAVTDHQIIEALEQYLRSTSYRS